MVKPGAAVIDVGMNRTDDGPRGDVDPDVVERRRSDDAGSGGVGPMTIAMLLTEHGQGCEVSRRSPCVPGDGR